MPWSAILPVLKLILEAAEPAAKQAALDELKKLADAEASSPGWSFLISEAEKLVAAA